MIDFKIIKGLTLKNFIEILNIMINNFSDETKMINSLMVSMTQRKDQFFPFIFTDFILMLAIYEKKTKNVNLGHFTMFLKEVSTKSSYCNVKLFTGEQCANTIIASSSLKINDNLFLREFMKVNFFTIWMKINI